jgi:hypothetical protein
MDEKGGYADSKKPLPGYANKNSKSAPPAHQPTELNIYGKFAPGPYKTDAQILAAVRPLIVDKWFPSSNELYRFASSGPGIVEGAVNLWNFLSLIYRYKPKRINIFTHGSDNGRIALSGRIVDGNVWFGKVIGDKLVDSLEIWLSGGSLQEAENAVFSDDKIKNITLPMVHDALPKEAHLYIYACHSGVDALELLEIEKRLKTKVHGFTNSILFRPIPSQDGKKIVDWKYSSDKAKTWHGDFHGLIPDLPRSP